MSLFAKYRKAYMIWRVLRQTQWDDSAHGYRGTSEVARYIRQPRALWAYAWSTDHWRLRAPCSPARAAWDLAGCDQVRYRRAGASLATLTWQSNKGSQRD